MDFEFLDAPARRSALLGLAAQSEQATLGLLGMTPEDGPIFVTESFDTGVIVGTYERCVLASAQSMGMTVLEPMVREGTGSITVYEVLADFDGGQFAPIAEGSTEQEAQVRAAATLRNLIGGTVMSLSEWLALQAADPLFEGDAPGQTAKQKAQRAAQWAQVVTVTLEGRPRADGWMSWKLLVPQAGDKVRLKVARQVLSEAGSLRRVTKGKTVVRYEVRAVVWGQQVFANYHDLVRAARSGVSTEGLTAWPGITADEFVVDRELQRQLTAQGWRRLWLGESEEDFARTRVAGGAVWVRDAAHRALRRLGRGRSSAERLDRTVGG